MSLSDQELILRALQKHDQRAFAQLVVRYQSQLRIWCRRLCNGDAALGDDLAQEVFIKAWGALAAFKMEAKFSVWLYRIAFNAAASKWRRKSLDWCDVDEIPEFNDEQDAAVELINERALHSALEQLTQPQQIALRLCYEDDLSHAQAASIMNIPLGSLKTHINRGKQRLKQLLADWSE
ncbi:MAG TPA: RNA polymerase sigma factor [Cellvibrionaceae bacterium]|nr:RNA polymerase sigma factor [Cellvibrionaceae bacterium]HMW46736.1 RNA polymerase sigma factor [Cellvibrionaceae bacterium]HMW72329.1 RNA polymerase sigma factor [Cellvibrionaceae bacterium]HMY40840.1 RNA polymerase sigma factor [Marinagarivorans sp.]HNG58318.1 RNA polymerase sigma factor [Cellvibrionaceae bacterium]